MTAIKGGKCIHTHGVLHGPRAALRGLEDSQCSAENPGDRPTGVSSKRDSPPPPSQDLRMEEATRELSDTSAKPLQSLILIFIRISAFFILDGTSTRWERGHFDQQVRIKHDIVMLRDTSSSLRLPLAS